MTSSYSSSNTPGMPVHVGGGVPLDQPLRGATIKDAFVRFWKKYATFSGRASRSEYWWWVLISVIIATVLQILDRLLFDADFDADPANGSGTAFLTGLWSLATLVPGLALIFRRLHDSNRSGWNVLWNLLPLIGQIVLLVFFLSKPKPEGARFDRDAGASGGPGLGGYGAGAVASTGPYGAPVGDSYGSPAAGSYGPPASGSVGAPGGLYGPPASDAPGFGPTGPGAPNSGPAGQAGPSSGTPAPGGSAPPS